MVGELLAGGFVAGDELDGAVALGADALGAAGESADGGVVEDAVEEGSGELAGAGGGDQLVELLLRLGHQTAEGDGVALGEDDAGTSDDGLVDLAQIALDIPLDVVGGCGVGRAEVSEDADRVLGAAQVGDEQVERAANGQGTGLKQLAVEGPPGRRRRPPECCTRYKCCERPAGW